MKKELLCEPIPMELKIKVAKLVIRETKKLAKKTADKLKKK